MWDEHRTVILAGEQLAEILVQSVPWMDSQDRADEMAELYRLAGGEAAGAGRGDGFDHVSLEQFRADIGAGARD